MRLLATKTISLHEFHDGDIPPYAILSHRWGQEEVTFNDVVNGLAPSRRGFEKVRGFCEQAATDGFEFCVRDDTTLS